MKRVSMLFGSAWLRVTATALLLVLLMLCVGCATREKTVVIRPDERIVHLEKGIPAPYAGWLLTDAQLIEIFEALERQLQK